MVLTLSDPFFKMRTAYMQTSPNDVPSGKKLCPSWAGVEYYLRLPKQSSHAAIWIFIEVGGLATETNTQLGLRETLQHVPSA
jgi:hypothetical protein